jgi:hypothetical protein
MSNIPSCPRRPGDRKACNSVNTALMQSITKIISHEAMKNHGKAWHELPRVAKHIAQEQAERNK